MRMGVVIYVVMGLYFRLSLLWCTLGPLVNSTAPFHPTPTPTPSVNLPRQTSPETLPYCVHSFLDVQFFVDRSGSRRPTPLSFAEDATLVRTTDSLSSFHVHHHPHPTHRPRYSPTAPSVLVEGVPRSTRCTRTC